MQSDNSGLKARLIQRTREVYRGNRVQVDGLQFHQPALGEYESLYAWDSGWHALAASAFDPEAGILELQALFSFQHDDGSVPHETRIKALGGSETLFRRFYIWLVRSQFDDRGRSLMVDPPSFLIAAAWLYRKTGDKRILDLLPHFQRCLDYLTTRRDLFGSGLISIIHPWECGCDMAPYFDEVVDADVRMPWWMISYEIKLQRLMRRLAQVGWSPERSVQKGIFAFEDVGFNGLTAAGALGMAELYRASGNETMALACEACARKIAGAIEKYLWDDDRGYFYPRWNIDHPRLSYRSCLNGVAPLITGLVSKEKAERVILEYIESPRHFATPWGISFNSLGEEDLHGFKHQMLWRGPCQWVNMNWIAAEAASAYGRTDLARTITTRTARLIDASGFREYYNPHTGEGGGVKEFCWPGLVLEMIERHGIENGQLG
jgi:glycogen debranching enzyme